MLGQAAAAVEQVKFGPSRHQDIACSAAFARGTCSVIVIHMRGKSVDRMHDMLRQFFRVCSLLAATCGREGLTENLATLTDSARRCAGR